LWLTDVLIQNIGRGRGRKPQVRVLSTANSGSGGIVAEGKPRDDVALPTRLLHASANTAPIAIDEKDGESSFSLPKLESTSRRGTSMIPILNKSVET
jgi:hypothetical protein